jgi:uncharacterized flavoprotein (TIGR03862 family)
LAAVTVNGAQPRVAVIGAGPAGLMAAQVLADGGAHVDVYDAMPSVGRKFLLAGKGGLNLTHSEAIGAFLDRYADRRAQIERWLTDFSPEALRQFVHGLGIDTFVGSSGRVFPTDMKAAPLLRAWLHRLRGAGVSFHMRHRWLGWREGSLRFSTSSGDIDVQADAVVLALGGASWPRLGSDGAWIALLRDRGVDVADLVPSNCGFDVAGWTEHFRSRFAGEPLKSVAITVRAQGNEGADRISQRGEFVVTETGVEGSLVYAASRWLRDDIAANGSATFWLDLLPDRSPEWVLSELKHPRGSRSLSTHLKTRLNLQGVKAGLLHERVSKDDFADVGRLAGFIKALPIDVVRPRPIEEAISSAGGVRFDALDDALMLNAAAGVFCAGEMLDWEAPTGGYLLTACFASGRVAGQGALRYLEQR